MSKLYNIHILNHNFDPERILDILTRQILLHEENIQLFLWDDFSDEEYRPIISNLQSKYNQSFLTWNLEQENVGRSAMRQKILDSTSSGWILSLDSDMLPDNDFVEQMISKLIDPATVYTGRHYYQSEPPSDSFLIHWNYGRKREMGAQNQNPYFHFSTGIFAVHSELAGNLYFDKELAGYGHEDTLFGLLLQQKKIRVTTTDMRAVHLGLIENDAFVNRQWTAVHNLREVMLKYPNYSSNLVKWGSRVGQIPFLNSWVSSDRFRRYCRDHLMKNPSNLLYLDLLKLSEYCRSRKRGVGSKL